MGQDMLMVKAADASAASAIVTDASGGSLWGVSLSVDALVESAGDRVLILTDTEIVPELEDALPGGVSILRSGGYMGLDSLSDHCLCYYLLGKGSA